MHTRFAALGGLLALTTACTYAEARGRDFLDCFKVEGALGPSLQADVQVTQLLHLGVGSSQTARSGFNYGVTENYHAIENFPPGSIVMSFADARQIGLHTLIVDERLPPTHHCFLVFPGLLDSDLCKVPPWHFFDLEAGAYALFPGVRVGFSPGEFVDFVLGFWLYDLAGDDDPEGRLHKSNRTCGEWAEPVVHRYPPTDTEHPAPPPALPHPDVGDGDERRPRP